RTAHRGDPAANAGACQGNGRAGARDLYVRRAHWSRHVSFGWWRPRTLRGPDLQRLPSSRATAQQESSLVVVVEEGAMRVGAGVSPPLFISRPDEDLALRRCERDHLFASTGPAHP